MAAKPSQAQKLAQIEAENDALKARLAQLEAKLNPPGLTAGVNTQPQNNMVYVGGQPVHLRPLPPAEFVKAGSELPMFIVALSLRAGFGLASAEKLQERLEVTAEDYQRIYDRAKGWLSVCAVEEVDVESLTVPEAEHVLAVVARQNGLSERVALVFQQMLAGSSADPGQRGETLRPEAELLSRLN